MHFTSTTKNLPADRQFKYQRKMEAPKQTDIMSKKQKNTENLKRRKNNKHEFEFTNSSRLKTLISKLTLDI